MRRRRAGTSGGISVDCSAVARAGASSPAGSPSVDKVGEGTKTGVAAGAGVGVGVGVGKEADAGVGTGAGVGVGFRAAVFCAVRNAPIAAANAATVAGRACAGIARPLSTASQNALP